MLTYHHNEYTSSTSINYVTTTSISTVHNGEVVVVLAMVMTIMVVMMARWL